jgi:hypothetical protein
MTWTVGIIIYIIVSVAVGIIVGRAIHYNNSDD